MPFLAGSVLLRFYFTYRLFSFMALRCKIAEEVKDDKDRTLNLKCNWARIILQEWTGGTTFNVNV